MNTIEPKIRSMVWHTIIDRIGQYLDVQIENQISDKVREHVSTQFSGISCYQVITQIEGSIDGKEYDF